MEVFIMSGQGAMLTISNRCPTSINVSASGEGMNTPLPKGDISAGGTMGPLYVEATLLGSSRFTLHVHEITILFVVKGWAYFVDNDKQEYQARTDGRLVTVSIQQKGEGAQDVISVHVVPLPTSSSGAPSAPIYHIVS
jgi:hypothetical protein